MAVPDLNDPAQRAAYRRELLRVARPVRWAGVGLAVLGAALLVISRRWTPLPGWLPWSVVGCAFVLMAIGITLRTRRHLRRMRGEG